MHNFAEYLRLVHSVYFRSCTLDCSLSICSEAGSTRRLAQPLIFSAAFVYKGSGAYGWAEYFGSTITFYAWFQWGACIAQSWIIQSQPSWVGEFMCECVSCVYVRCKVNYSGKWIQHSLHVTRRQSTNFYRHRPAIWRPSTTVCLLRLSRCMCVYQYAGIRQSVCINFITTTQHSTTQYSRAKQFPSRTLPQHKILCEARLRLLSSSENLHVIRTEFLRALRK